MAGTPGGAKKSAPRQFRFEVHDAQRMILQDPHRFLCIPCGRRFGKDHLAAIKIITHSLSHSSPRGYKLYAYLNPIYNPQSKDSFRIFTEFAASGGLIKRKVETPPMKVVLKNDDVVNFFSADQPDNLRGGQYDGIIGNEAGFIHDIEGLWTGPLRAMLLDRKGFAWLQGTPNGHNGFHKFYLKGLSNEPDNDWKSFRFPTHANPFIDHEELEKIRKDTPEAMWRQEYLAEFIDGAGTVFKGMDRMKARSAGLVLLPQADNCRIGVDIGRHGDYTVLIALSPNNQVIGFDRFTGMEWPIIERRILAFISRYRGVVVIDSTGSGDPLYENLARKGMPVIAAKFTNERKRMWVQNLAMLIEQDILTIPWGGMTADAARDTQYLWSELQSYTYDMTTYGKVRYSAPVGFNDDCVTALYLAASEIPPITSYGLDGDISQAWLNHRLNDVLQPGESALEGVRYLH